MKWEFSLMSQTDEALWKDGGYLPILTWFPAGVLAQRGHTHIRTLLFDLRGTVKIEQMKRSKIFFMRKRRPCWLVKAVCLG